MSSRSRETLLVVLSRRVTELRIALVEARFIAGASHGCSNCKRVHELLTVELDRISELRRSEPKNDS